MSHLWSIDRLGESVSTGGTTSCAPTYCHILSDVRDSHTSTWGRMKTRDLRGSTGEGMGPLWGRGEVCHGLRDH